MFFLRIYFRGISILH